MNNAQQAPERISGRSAALDALRVFGIIAVVAGHVWDGPLLRELVYTWHVPLFFFLSGYLWNTKRTLRAELRSRWTSIGVPYVCWLFVLGVVFVAWTAIKHQFDPLNIARVVLGGEYLGRPFSAFWFMSALLFAAVLYRLLWKRPVILILVIGLTLTGSTLLPQVLAAFPLDAGVGVAATIYIFAGHLFAQGRNRVPHPIVVGMAGLVLSAIFVGLHFVQPLDMKKADFGTPGISVLASVVISASLVLLFENLPLSPTSSAGRVVTELAVCGTGVVLSHAAILWVLVAPPEGSIADFVLALAVPWAVALGLARTRLAPLLLGSRPRYTGNR